MTMLLRKVCIYLHATQPAPASVLVIAFAKASFYAGTCAYPLKCHESWVI